MNVGRQNAVCRIACGTKARQPSSSTIQQLFNSFGETNDEDKETDLCAIKLVQKMA